MNSVLKVPENLTFVRFVSWTAEIHFDWKNKKREIEVMARQESRKSDLFDFLIAFTWTNIPVGNTLLVTRYCHLLSPEFN